VYGYGCFTFAENVAVHYQELGNRKLPACSDSEHFVASRMSRHVITITVQWVALDGS